MFKHPVSSGKYQKPRLPDKTACTLEFLDVTSHKSIQTPVFIFDWPYKVLPAKLANLAGKFKTREFGPGFSDLVL